MNLLPQVSNIIAPMLETIDGDFELTRLTSLAVVEMPAPSSVIGRVSWQPETGQCVVNPAIDGEDETFNGCTCIDGVVDCNPIP